MERTELDIAEREGELPYTPKGWRNLYVAAKDFFSSDDGRLLHAGSIFYGSFLFPSREAAVSALNNPGVCVQHGLAEWLGAFEVDS